MIKLVRHGQSLANIGKVKQHEVGDSTIEISALGRQQAFEAGKQIGSQFLESSLIYCSPYQRTRQTCQEIMNGANITPALNVYEDPRLREVERGYLDERPQHPLRKVHGWFYYRHAGGESPADCYDRTCSFLESLMRQAQRKNVRSALIISHGMTIRCFVMRFLHLTVEQFDMMKNPANGDIITIGNIHSLKSTHFTNGRYGVQGLRLRSEGAQLHD